MGERMKNNGFKTVTRVLGGHRVKVLVPPHHDWTPEERLKRIEKFGEKLRKIAERQREKGIQPSRSD